MTPTFCTTFNYLNLKLYIIVLVIYYSYIFIISSYNYKYIFKLFTTFTNILTLILLCLVDNFEVQNYNCYTLLVIKYVYLFTFNFINCLLLYDFTLIINSYKIIDVYILIHINILIQYYYTKLYYSKN